MSNPTTVDLRKYVEGAVSAAPSLSREQFDRLAALLTAPAMQDPATTEAGAA